MSDQTLTTFFALLALTCLIAVVVVGAVAALVAARGGPPLLVRLRRDLGRAAFGLAWVVATVATAGSLWYSEVVGFVPCPLCWFQRIFMYPLVIVLGLALLRRDRGARAYGLGLAVPGALVAAYHSWLQAFPTGESTFCTPDAPCTVRHVWEFGFVSLPLMALSGFIFIITMLVVAGGRAAGHVEE